MQVDAADRDKQLRIMTDQNAELLRLLEQEEAQTARLSTTNEVLWGTRFRGSSEQTNATALMSAPIGRNIPGRF